MKKKILVSMAIVAFSVAAFYIPVREVKADCPNGCLVNHGDGCWCNGWYPNLKEGPVKPASLETK